jgi:O-antigen ligase
MFKNLNLDKTFQFLLIILAFLMPLTVFCANLIIVIIVALWLVSGNYKSKYDQIISSRFLIACVVFYCLHVVGLIWTEDLKWGLKILHKMWYFILLLPVLFTIVEKKYIKYYISSFLLAISFTEIISYLIWFEIIEPFKIVRIPDTLSLMIRRDGPVPLMVNNPTPFMSHVSYNPILAFAIYLVSHEVFLNKNLSKFKFFLFSFFAITMSINMFITGGRAGQVIFFVMLTILIFQFFNAEKIKSLIVVLILIPGIFFTAYQTSDLFQLRVDSAISDVLVYESNNNTSVGKRISYMKNSWDIIKQNPWIGVGTGDFPIEFEKISIINNNQDFLSTNLPTNPHNMYNFVLIQLGLVGLLSFLSIFYYQIKQSFVSSNRLIRDVGLTLPLLFLVVMLSDSYLLGHYTSLMFVFFSAFLYKDFEKN